MLGLMSYGMAQPIEYRKLKEEVEILAVRGLPAQNSNIIANGISKQLHDSWAILLMQIQEYIEFRTKDETVNLVDVSTTFQNILSIKDLLEQAVRIKALSTEGASIQMLVNVNKMINDKLYKIKNIPVLGLGKEYDLWYLLQKLAEFLNNFKNRILLDQGKLQEANKKSPAV